MPAFHGCRVHDSHVIHASYGTFSSDIPWEMPRVRFLTIGLNASRD